MATNIIKTGTKVTVFDLNKEAVSKLKVTYKSFCFLEVS